MNTLPDVVYIVGSGRSGTTIVLKALDVAVTGMTAVPRLAGRFPQCAIPASLLKRFGLGPDSWRCTSAESTAIFSEAGITQEKQVTLQGRSMRLDDVGDHAANIFRHRINQIRTWTKTSTVIIKNTASCARIPLLNEFHPQANFIEVIRHPTAVVSSLVKASFWSTMVLWWDGRTTQEYCSDHGISNFELAARHWNTQVLVLREGLKSIPDHRQFCIRYEDFVLDPAGVLVEAGFTGLDQAALNSLNVRKLRDLSTYDTKIWNAVESECAQGMQSLGYELTPSSITAKQRLTPNRP